MKKLSLLAVLAAIAFISFSFKKKPPVSVVSKSLAFPVAGKKSNIGSFWGAVRDGGKRKHEGIDIFASKGTPVVAISDGVIISKGTFPRGGKILWLKASGHPWSAYYAHLDKWLVKEGQYVKKGQVIGTVGNTGNARYTPSHLHFGIYTERGAVNPLPYVKKAPKIVIQKKAVKRKTTTAKKTNIKKQRTKR